MCHSTAEGFFIELKLRKKKWLFCYSFNPHQRFVSNYVIDIGKNLDLLQSNYDNILLLGGFNAEVENNFLKEVWDSGIEITDFQTPDKTFNTFKYLPEFLSEMYYGNFWRV